MRQLNYLKKNTKKLCSEIEEKIEDNVETRLLSKKRIEIEM